MKIKNYLIAAIIALPISSNVCVAQEAARVDDPSREIVAQSTFLSYKAVKDNFGKKFAQSYFVIQVDIRNEKLDKQFIVQTLDVMLDPNQCANGIELYSNFDVTRCKEIFEEYFIFPSIQQPTRREEVIGTGKADLNRSRRNIGFRILAFSASMGSILTGFDGVLGPDGVKGINVLGTTVTAAVNGLFPNTADEKLENLKNAIPTEDVIIKSKESKTFNVFIPTERVFWKKSWRRYIRPANDSDEDTYALKVVLDLLLLSSATGVLVDNNAEKVTVKSDDTIRRQTEKFALAKITPGEAKLAKEAFDIIQKLNSDRAKPETADKLKKIIAELRKESRFNTFLKVTDKSTNEEIIKAIRLLSRDLSTGKDRDPVLLAKFQQIIIDNGN